MKKGESDQAQFAERAELLKAMAHPVRLCILRGLQREGECNVSHMQACLELPQSTVSQHLARLRQAGIITPSRHGVEVYYTLASPLIGDLLEKLFS